MFIRQLEWSQWGSPSPCRELGWLLPSCKAPLSALSHGGFATLDWRVGLKVNSDTNSQSDIEEDSGSYVHEEVGMDELAFCKSGKWTSLVIIFPSCTRGHKAPAFWADEPRLPPC